MSKSENLSVLLDAVNERGRPVLGVRYKIWVDGVEALTAVKSTPAQNPLMLENVEGPVEVEASLAGFKKQKIQLVAENISHTFVFPGAGIPAVLVVCALAKETRAVLDTCDSESRLPARYRSSADSNEYWVGRYKSSRSGGVPVRVLVATSGMGTIGAAIAATQALCSFPDDIKQILMVGIAGGCPNHEKVEDHVRLGDIVVANERGVVQYDFIKRTLDGDIHRANPHRPSAEFMRADEVLEIGRLAGTRPWEDVISQVVRKRRSYQRPAEGKDVLRVGKRKVRHPLDPERRLGKPRVHRGGIGSANILLKHPTYRDKIRDKFGVKAIEMEGSGVMDAGWAVNKDVMVVRGICDYCDEYKNDDWQVYAALVAAAYARCLVLAIYSGR